MKTWSFGSWLQFEDALKGFHELPVMGQRRFLFRGQSQASWPLSTSLDRVMAEKGIKQRDQFANRLLAAFKLQSAGIESPNVMPDDGQAIAWELLARHHGLPTSVIDWTWSPYVAAFFAAEGAADDKPFSLYLFNQAGYFAAREGELSDDPIVLLSEYSHLSYNRRAIEQQAVAMKVSSLQETLDDELGDFLWRFDISGSQRSDFLKRLFTMRITSRTLFRSMDHAARTAAWFATTGEANS